jgi:hypothetical protein
MVKKILPYLAIRNVRENFEEKKHFKDLFE